MILFFSIIFIACIIFIHKNTIDYDYENYTAYIKNLNYEIANVELRNLINANTIVNLPSVKVNNMDSNVDYQKCLSGVYLMTTNLNADLELYRDSCNVYCGAGSGLIKVDENTEIYEDNKRLSKGIWCFTDVPECNTNTTYVIVGLGRQTTCISKFPNMFDNTGFKTIACNDEVYYNSKNILWDYLYNVQVNPVDVVLNNEDEKLPDGQFRFRCKYDLDINMNRFIEHPSSRFHPLQDPCKINGYALSEDVKFVTDGANWHCDCGDFQKTRVRNCNANDNRSVCTSCFNGTTTDNKSVVFAPCFRLCSNFDKPLKVRPCSYLDLIANGSGCTQLSVNLVQTDDELAIPPFVSGDFKNSKFDVCEDDLVFTYR